MLVSFSLEAAKQALGVNETIEECVNDAATTVRDEAGKDALLHIGHEPETLWHKIDHLLYLPVLGLNRPRDLYYYQGDGLQALYGFTYKYLTLEHFLGQLSHLKVGYPLADALAYHYSQAWYRGKRPLVLFTDWHVKPHWCKEVSHSGHVTMWGRTMPGTKQLMLNGLGGYLLGGWNYPIDTHMTQVLVEMETELSKTLQRPILCNIFDSEGSSQAIGERYAAADANYLTVLPRHYRYRLEDFVIDGEWQPVIDDPSREAVYAQWADMKKASKESRQLVLLRPIGDQEPTRIYVGRLPEDVPASMAPWLHRQRWADNEHAIRNLIKGANLNQNYGYSYDLVPHRTRKREWEAAQAQVEATQKKQEQSQEALHNLRQQRQQLQQSDDRRRVDIEQEIVQRRLQLRQRQQLAKPTKRVEKRLLRLRSDLTQLAARCARRLRRLSQQIVERRTQLRRLQRELAQRIASRDAIDTATLCRERHLEKDQIMLNWQVLLANCHDWARRHFFAPAWHKLSLERATQLIYRKSGQVTHFPDRIEVVFNAYRYAEQQRAMEESCRRFNGANLRWRDGRLLRFSVQTPP
jgi:hypothetical protein